MKSLQVNSILNAIRSIMRLVFPLLTLPYVSRVLQVDNLGKYNFASTFTLYFSYLAALGINGYSIREGAALRDKKAELDNFIKEVFTINVISTIVSYFLLVVITLNSSKVSDYKEIIFILSINILFTTIGTEWLFSIFEDYWYITIRSIVFQIISILLLFVFVKDQSDINMYAFLTVISGSGSNIMNWFYAKKYCRISLARLSQVWKHIIPILTIFISDIAILIYVNSDITMLGLMTTDYCVGLYSLSTKIYVGLKTLIGALIVVSIPRLSYLWGNHQQKEYFITLYKIFSTIMTFLLPLVVGIIMIKDDIILLFGGSNYLEASTSLMLLCIAAIFCELSYIYTQCILMPMHKEKSLMKITIISAVVNIILNLFFIPLWRQNGAAITTIIAEFIVYVLSMYTIKGKVSFKTCYGTLLKSGIGCIVIAGVCILARWITQDTLLYITISAGLSIAFYVITEIALKNQIVMEMVAGIHSIKKNIKKL